jgi:hypothetical protein
MSTRGLAEFANSIRCYSDPKPDKSMAFLFKIQAEVSLEWLLYTTYQRYRLGR